MRLLILLLLWSGLFAQPILLDGHFEDWKEIDNLYLDTEGDGLAGLDLLSVSISSDSARVFFFLEFAEELAILKNNELTLYFDTDNDTATGLSIGGLGAEMAWNFGRKEGAHFSGGDSTRITHGDIGLITLPTITSRYIEIAVDRSDLPPGSDLSEPIHSFTFLLVDEQDPQGDRLPDTDGGLYVELSADGGIPWETCPLARFADTDIRIMSQNVLHDGLYNEERSPAHARILRALDPDIVALQEMWQTSNQATIAYLDSIMPLPGDQGWYSTEMEGHVVTASRFPIMGNWTLWGHSGSRIMALLVQIDADHQVLVMNCHWSCCGADENRQLQADTTIAFLRDAFSAGGQIDLSPNTPVVILGDMNLVGDSQQLTTLLTGDIQNEVEFGPDYPPDWDGSDLRDLCPVHLSERVAFSWQNEGEGYSPGRLDYIVYTDHVTEVRNNFILNTRTMTDEQLSANGLLRTDSKVASDHLALVADFSILPDPEPVEERGLKGFFKGIFRKTRPD